MSLRRSFHCLLIYLVVFPGLAKAAVPVAFLGGFTSPSSPIVITDLNLEKGTKVFFHLHPSATADLQITKFDNQGVGSTTVLEVQKILAAGIRIIIGISKSNQALIVAPLVDKGDALLFTPISTNDEVTRNHPNVFRTCFSDSSQGDSLARFTRDVLKPRQVLILTNADSTYSVGLADSYQKGLGKAIPVTEVRYLADSLKIEPLKQALQKHKPAVVFIPDYAHTAVQIVKDLYPIAPETTFLGGDGWGSRELLDEHLWKVPVKAFYASHWSEELATPTNKVFLKGYKQLYPNENNSPAAALMYDTLNILWDAVKKLKPGEVTVEALKKQFLSTTYTTTTGSLSFPTASNPTPQKKVVLIRFRMGKHELERVY